MDDEAFDRIAKLILQAERKKPVPDPYAGERCVYEPGICMRLGCGGPRWNHPEKGELVVCQYHGEEIFRGEAKAPPLRPFPDYVSTARKTFLVQDLNGLPIEDSHIAGSKEEALANLARFADQLPDEPKKT